MPRLDLCDYSDVYIYTSQNPLEAQGAPPEPETET